MVGVGEVARLDELAKLIDRVGAVLLSALADVYLHRSQAKSRGFLASSVGNYRYYEGAELAATGTGGIDGGSTYTSEPCGSTISPATVAAVITAIIIGFVGFQRVDKTYDGFNARPPNGRRNSRYPLR
jgi:hypothetical protein